MVLASGSPRRAELVSSLGIEVEIVVPDVDEQQRPGERPTELVERLARAKRDAVVASVGADADAGIAVLAADTIVVLDGQVLGKPADPHDAARMLRAISGVTHDVITGVSVARGLFRATEICTTAVTLRSLSDDEINDYVATGDPLDKAGAYGIQSGAARFVERVEGNYQSVVGLPLTVAERLLAAAANATGPATSGTS